MGSLFKHFRDLTENETPTLGAVLSWDGAILSDEGSCLEQWKDCFFLLLNNTSPSVPPKGSLNQSSIQRPEADFPPDEPFSPSEIKTQLKGSRIIKLMVSVG